MEGGTTIQIWQIIIGLITALCTVGGVGYLLVDSLVNRRKNREEVKHQQTENIKNAVEYGVPMIEIYKEIDKIIEEKTAPILDELADIKRNWCCYRESCGMRLRTEMDMEKMIAEEERVVKHKA